MKKAYVLDVGRLTFVFSSQKALNMAMEWLDQAEFAGESSWRRGSCLVEQETPISSRVVEAGTLKLVTRLQNEMDDAIARLREARKNGTGDEEKAKRLSRAEKACKALGIDPSTVKDEVEEDD